MGRAKLVYQKEQIHVWILPNQAKDMRLCKAKLKKSNTQQVMEALGTYYNALRNQGVL